ncbi:MAG TPA: VOC family protein [Nitrososphaerales archaeon]|nr:VOC family protein [Nitrososphaerales archaeon]
MTGKVVHFEIPANDVKRASAFYKDVFGWWTMDMPGVDYMMLGGTKVSDKGVFSESGSINGGMMKRTKPFEHPIITIGVEDIDATLKAIEKKGGKTLRKKQDIGQDMGWTAYFVDPEGNLMGLYQSGNPM